MTNSYRDSFSDLPPVPDGPAACPWFLASWHMATPVVLCSSSGHKPRNPMQASSIWWIMLPQKKWAHVHTPVEERGEERTVHQLITISVLLPGFQIQRKKGDDPQQEIWGLTVQRYRPELFVSTPYIGLLRHQYFRLFFPGFAIWPLKDTIRPCLDP